MTGYSHNRTEPRDTGQGTKVREDARTLALVNQPEGLPNKRPDSSPEMESSSRGRLTDSHQVRVLTFHKIFTKLCGAPALGRRP